MKKITRLIITIIKNKKNRDKNIIKKLIKIKINY